MGMKSLHLGMDPGFFPVLFLQLKSMIRSWNEAKGKDRLDHLKYGYFHSGYLPQVQCCWEVFFPPDSPQHCGASHFSPGFSPISALMQSPHGCHVVQTSLDFPDPAHTTAIFTMVAMSSPNCRGVFSLFFSWQLYSTVLIYCYTKICIRLSEFSAFI